jgi:serine/threonine-protein kinase
MLFSPGTVLDGRYEVLGVLGEGGMATVYKVRHLGLRSVHALKVLNAAFARNDEARARFLEEGRIQARVRHPNIVPVTEIVTQPVSGLVMDFVEGPTLEAHLGLHGPLTSREEVEALFFPLLDAMEIAHAAGVVHRDLKPANILLGMDARGEVQPRITDFGVAHWAEGSAPKTRLGAKMGTSLYMSPEQVRGGAAVDARSDVFALGAILYEVVTGEHAFAAPSEFETLAAITEGRYPDPRDRAPAVAPSILRCIRVALCVRPKDRFPSCAAFRDALGTSPPSVSPRRRTSTGALRAVSPSTPADLRAPPPLPEPALRRRTPSGVQRATSSRSIPVVPEDSLHTELFEPPSSDTEATEWVDVPAELSRTAPRSEPAPSLVSSPEAGPVSWTLPLGGLAAGVAILVGVSWCALPGSQRSVRPTAPAAPRTVAAKVPPPPVPAERVRPSSPPPVSAPAENRVPSPGPPRAKTSTVGPAPPVERRATYPVEFRVTPWARVFLDGQPIGETPMDPLRVEEGLHEVKLVNAELGTERVLLVKVGAGPNVVKVRMDDAVEELPSRREVSQDEIMALVVANKATIQKCVQDQRTRDPRAWGKIEMGWTLQPTGRATDIRCETPEFRDSHLAACLALWLRSTPFPKHSGPPQRVRFPLSF